MPYADLEDKRANARKYRAAHREAICAKGLAYYYANHERALVAGRAYYAAHRERYAALRAAYRAAHPLEEATYRRAYAAAHRGEKAAYAAAHREEKASYMRAYSAANLEARRAYRATRPEIFRAADARRRALQLGLGAGATTAQVAARWDYYGGRCWMCGAEATQTDHVKPISKGGNNLPANLRPACGPCNRRKRDQWPLAVAA